MLKHERHIENCVILKKPHLHFTCRSSVSKIKEQKKFFLKVRSTKFKNIDFSDAVI